MKAEEIVKRYDEMKKEIKLLDFQLSRFEGISEKDIIDTMTFSHPDGEKVMASTSTDKIFNIGTKYKKITERKNDEWYEFLIRRRINLSEETEFFEQSIEMMEHHDIAKAMFIEKLSWAEMESLFSLSHAAIGKYRKQALKELEDIYDTRDKQLESYLLN